MSLGSTFKSELDFVVRLAGEAGEGVISAGELFAQAAARTEYHVFTYITYPAEMRGGFSMIQVRVRDWRVYSMGSHVDYLVAFNQTAYERTIGALRPGGTLIYDPEMVEVKEDGQTRLYPIPFNKIAVTETGSKLGKNVVALGALGNLFQIELKTLEELVVDRYGKKGSEVIEKNHRALRAGFAAGQQLAWKRRYHLKPNPEAKTHYMMLSGNEACALGAIVAGCRFVAGYPITPATPILETMAQLLPKVGGKAIQLEDEIAAISACIGASFGGVKVMTPTSGPGLQLMGEQLNLAAMIEVPLVVIDVQRGGPSTGLPTKTEQSDLKFAVYGSVGEVPRVILAPTSVEDCFYQTIRAFNIAERFQMPVIMLTDQSIGYRKATVPIPDLSEVYEADNSIPSESIIIPSEREIELATRLEARLDGQKEFNRYEDTPDGVSPVTRPGTPGGQYLASGLEHDPSGRANYTPLNHLQMTRKRFKKLEALSRAFEKNPPEYHGSEEAVIGVIGWGSTEGAIREARYLAAERGILVRHLHPKVISPLPERQIRRFLMGLKQVIIVEENYTGQFAHFVKAKFGVKPIEVHKCEGVPITPQEILAAIVKVEEIVDEAHITRV